jgi:uncharacterized membrane protein
MASGGIMVRMIGRAIAVFMFLVGAALWAVGGWQVYRSNTVVGAVLVLAGALVVVSVVSWWRRDPHAGFETVWQGVIEFFSRA